MIVVFADSDSWTSKIIKAVDGSDVSHVAIYSPNIANGSIMFHSSREGVEMITRETFKRRYRIKRCYQVDPAGELTDAEIMGVLLRKYEDAKYDYLGVIFLGLYLLVSRLGLHVRARNLWNDRNAFFCTEFVSLGIFGEIPEILSLTQLEKNIVDRMAYERVTFG